ncbi:MAG: deoxyribonuclease IV [Anaerolineae bacterium]|nr:deoxyribonuclease IV [Anaerolineales bacterium]MCQ3978218.1 deoxyribonuclease IV [Anaerolineae bacterium]
MLLGAHMSVSGGVDTAFERAIAINCTALQIFTKSNRQWQAKDLEAEVIERFLQAQTACGLPVVCHASYLLNLGTPDDAIWHKSIEALIIELQRCEQLKIPYLVLHCGGHMGSGVEAGLARVAAGLDIAHQRLPGYQVKIALEISAGQGTHLGVTFEEIAQMIRLCRAPERLAVCFDTCHALAAGYEFRTPDSYEVMIAEFERVIGLDRLAVFHLNDSEKDLGSRVDRHTHIGEGCIGLEPFGYFLNDPRFKQIPFLLETPVDDDPGDNIRNLEKLRSLVKTEDGR